MPFKSGTWLSRNLKSPSDLDRDPRWINPVFACCWHAAPLQCPAAMSKKDLEAGNHYTATSPISQSSGPSYSSNPNAYNASYSSNPNAYNAAYGSPSYNAGTSPTNSAPYPSSYGPGSAYAVRTRLEKGAG